MTFKDVAESLTWEEWEQLAAARKGFCEESTKDAGSTVVPGKCCSLMSCRVHGLGSCSSFLPVAVREHSDQKQLRAGKRHSSSLRQVEAGT